MIEGCAIWCSRNIVHTAHVATRVGIDIRRLCQCRSVFVHFDRYEHKPNLASICFDLFCSGAAGDGSNVLEKLLVQVQHEKVNRIAIIKRSSNVHHLGSTIDVGIAADVDSVVATVARTTYTHSSFASILFSFID